MYRRYAIVAESDLREGVARLSRSLHQRGVGTESPLRLQHGNFRQTIEPSHGTGDTLPRHEGVSSCYANGPNPLGTASIAGHPKVRSRTNTSSPSRSGVAPFCQIPVARHALKSPPVSSFTSPVDNSDRFGFVRAYPHAVPKNARHG